MPMLVFQVLHKRAMRAEVVPSYPSQNGRGARGYVVERWVLGCAAENSSPFLPLRFCNRPLFFWKSSFDIGCLHVCFKYNYWLQKKKKKNGWICSKVMYKVYWVYWAEGKTENLVWMWVANLVHLGFPAAHLYHFFLCCTPALVWTESIDNLHISHNASGMGPIYGYF